MCWVPILKAKKLILAGDPMQLPPTILSLDRDRKDKKGKEKSSAKGAKKTSPSALNQKGKPSESSAAGAVPRSTEASSGSDLDAPDTSDPEIVKVAADVSSLSLALQAPKRALPVLVPPRTLETTLFDRLEKMYGPSIKRMLEVQYR